MIASKEVSLERTMLLKWGYKVPASRIIQHEDAVRDGVQVGQ